jgi:MFS family permease
MNSDDAQVTAHLAEVESITAYPPVVETAFNPEGESLAVAEMPAGGAGSALRSPVMRAIVASETLSSLGSQMTFVALPWFVLLTTGSATRMGLIFAIELLPIALLGIPSGALVARLGIRRTMLICDGVRAPLIALVPILHIAGVLSFGSLAAVVFAMGVFTSPYVAAQRLVIPEAFGDNESLVVQGNAMVEGATRLANFVGPAIAGLLIAAINPVNVLWIDAGSFAVSFAILLVGLPKPAVSLAEAATAGTTGALAGAKFVMTNPLLRRVSAAALLFGLFFPMLLASLPVITDRRFDANPRIAGLLFAAWGAGALLGTFGVLRFASKLPPMRMGALAGIALAVPLWLLTLPLPSWGFGLVLLVSGVFTPMLNAPLITLILLRSPEDLRAQTITFVMTANLLAGPIGYAVAGPLLQSQGITTVMWIIASGISLAALLLISLVRAPLTPVDASPGEAEPTA